ncbi:MAG TPA: zinc ribbon domain-containing protein [Candidatus Methanoperedens sp.]|nr:zinc ribbon domain-containing protein [Candidatus Methanoperedens sp.]HLB71703.1 zinc ribbon domain-containing protein [Candidatus Methanoperedens sp.]
MEGVKMKCPNCGFENPEMAKFCGKCGTVIRTTQTGSNPSGAWYLVPFFFGILGGIIGYFAMRDKNKGMANNLLIVGIVSSIFWWIILAGLNSY